ncbi:hypothetical protein HC762_01700 [bacterium]|nr:hypothetical protein [bacterium]
MIVLLLLISRSKLVPDFALTVHLLHLVTTWLYSRSVPMNLLWWGLQAGSAAIMVSLGVWACRYRELRPISFGAASAAVMPASTGGDHGDELEDHVRGGGGRLGGRGMTKSRHRGEAPSYEMVGGGDLERNIAGAGS